MSLRIVYKIITRYIGSFQFMYLLRMVGGFNYPVHGRLHELSRRISLCVHGDPGRASYKEFLGFS